MWALRGPNMSSKCFGVAKKTIRTNCFVVQCHSVSQFCVVPPKCIPWNRHWFGGMYSLHATWSTIFCCFNVLLQFQLGSATLQQEADASVIIKAIFEQAIESTSVLHEKITSLQSDNERLASERSTALKVKQGHCGWSGSGIFIWTRLSFRQVGCVVLNELYNPKVASGRSLHSSNQRIIRCDDIVKRKFTVWLLRIVEYWLLSHHSPVKDSYG